MNSNPFLNNSSMQTIQKYIANAKNRIIFTHSLCDGIIVDRRHLSKFISGWARIPYSAYGSRSIISISFPFWRLLFTFFNSSRSQMNLSLSISSCSESLSSSDSERKEFSSSFSCGAESLGLSFFSLSFFLFFFLLSLGYLSPSPPSPSIKSLSVSIIY